jgi:ATP-dependent Lon protease
VKPEVAVCGELTLRGTVLPVGGIKDQVLAAHRAGIREIVMPKQNARDLEEVPAEIKADLKIHLVSRLDEVLPLVLAEPEPDPDQDEPPAPNAPAAPEAHV